MSQKIAYVTGGMGGIGTAICQRLHKEGFRVIAGCGPTRDHAKWIAEQAALGYTFYASVGNVGSWESTVEAFTKSKAEHGSIDVLVNNAGGAPFAAAATASPRFSESIIRLNLIAPLNFSQVANRVMQEQDQGGCIINIASVSTIRPSPGTAAYGAAKAGLVNLGTSLAVEWAPKVRVNALVVGLTETEQAHLHYGDKDGIAAVGATIPLGRMAVPTDVGNACLFLASKLASYVSGTNFAVHGGGEKPAFLNAANVKS